MAEIALGIVPIFVGGLKGANAIRQRLPILTNHGGRTRQLRQQLEGEIVIFGMQCQMLLGKIVDYPQAEAMIGTGGAHPMWSSPEIDDKLRQLLGPRFSYMCEISGDIARVIRELDVELDKYTRLDGDGNAIQASVAREAANLLLNESFYETKLDEMVKANHNFTKVREGVCELENQRKHWNERQKENEEAQRSARTESIISSFQTIASNAQSVHEALKKSWTCSRVEHDMHLAKLLLQPEGDNDIRVLIEPNAGPQAQWLNMTEELIDMLVQCDGRNADMPKASQTRTRRGPARRAKKVRQTGGQFPVSAMPAPVDKKDLCSDLFQQFQRGFHEDTEPIRCHIDASDSVRHELVLVPPLSSIAYNNKGPPVALSSILHSCQYENLSFSQQMRLAAQLVRGILQFHSTSWLEDLWRLQDIHFFHIGDDLSQSLETLHLTSSIPRVPSQDDTGDSQMLEVTGQTVGSSSFAYPTPPDSQKKSVGDSTALQDSLQRAKNDSGVTNVPLYSLGVALLQIGLWDPSIDAGQIGEVRSKSEYLLGKRYKHLVRQCLYCNFRVDHDYDLKSTELLEVVYHDVVLTLEEMAREDEASKPDRGVKRSVYAI